MRVQTYLHKDFLEDDNELWRDLGLTQYDPIYEVIRQKMYHLNYEITLTWDVDTETGEVNFIGFSL